MGSRRKRKPVTLDTVRRHALALPGVVEGTSYGTPAFRVRKKLFARMHQDEDAVVVRMDQDTRDLLIQDKPQTFYITDHYLEYPWVLVRLGTVEEFELEGMLEQAWRRFASQRMLDDYDAEA